MSANYWNISDGFVSCCKFCGQPMTLIAADDERINPDEIAVCREGCGATAAVEWERDGNEAYPIDLYDWRPSGRMTPAEVKAAVCEALGIAHDNDVPARELPGQVSLLGRERGQ